MFKEYKYEILIGAGLALVFVYLFQQLMTIKPRPVQAGEKISFEMIRPQQDMANEFTLDDREIDSRFVNPFVKKSLHKDTKNVKPNMVPITKTGNVKKKEKSNKEEVKKTGITTNVVSRDNKPPMESEPDSGYSNQQPNQTVTNTNNDNAKNDTKKNEEKDKKRSISEFLDLLTNPTKERVNQLVTAVKNNEINQSEFYSFVGKMLSSQNPNVQSVGVYLAYYMPTYESFRMVVVNQDKMSPEVKTYSEQFLTSFNQPEKLPVLAQALQSNDIKVVVKAGEMVILGLQKIKNGQTIDYGARSNRGNNEVKSSSFVGYFLSIAEGLKSNPNQTIAGLGSALSQQLSQISNTP